MMSSLVHTWHPLRAPAAASRRRRIHHTRRFIFISRCAVEERTVIESYKNLNGNGRGINYEEVEREGKNGKLNMYLESDNGNGGLMKYEEGNGVAGKLGNMQVEERERKKRIEEIGKEDAWFKTFGDQPQVHVTFWGKYFNRAVLVSRSAWTICSPVLAVWSVLHEAKTSLLKYLPPTATLLFTL